MKFYATSLVLGLLLGGVSQAEEAAKCPWKLVTGKWRLSDDTGNSSTVVWKKATSDGNALLGFWKGDNGEATELVGWCPDKKELVAVGFGNDGAYWHIVFTTVTESMLKGDITERRADGKTRSGIYQITKQSDTKSLTHILWKDTDGENASVKGSFIRQE